MPVLALDYRNAIARGFCEAGGYMDYRMPSVRRDQSSSLQVGCDDLALKIDGVQHQPGRPGTDQGDMEFRRSRDKMKLVVADSGTPRYHSAGATAGTGKGESMPIVLDTSDRTTDGLTGRSPSGGARDARPVMELSLIQSTPVRLPGTPQAGNDRPAEQWMWASDSSIAEPGIWVVLIAGFLGMCAVARRRFLIS